MTNFPDDTVSLVADIGGTNTRVALSQKGALRAETVRRYRNADNPSLEAVLKRFLGEMGDPDCKGASVAVAGPVRDGVGRLTNLDWSIDEETLAKATKAETLWVLNDLEAQGYALGSIAPQNIKTVVQGKAGRPGAAELVVGIGTGFNAAPVLQSPFGRTVAASESGHITLPIRSNEDYDLARFIENMTGFASVEDVLSGRGVARVYAWAAGRSEMDGTEDIATIMQACADQSDPVAEKTVATVVRMIGTVTGNLALVCLPFAGTFFIGGVARAMAPYFDRFGFADAFCDKGRFGPFMSDFSIYVIEDDYAALQGLAAHLEQRHS
ncbi:MAG: ROK family protein [Pseudomonadota bacterium]